MDLKKPIPTTKNSYTYPHWLVYTVCYVPYSFLKKTFLKFTLISTSMRLFDGSYLCRHIVNLGTPLLDPLNSCYLGCFMFWCFNIDNMMLQSSYWGSPHLRTCKCRLSMWRAITKKLYCLCAKQWVHVCRKGSPLNCNGWTFAVHFIYNFAAQHAWPSNVYIVLKNLVMWFEGVIQIIWAPRCRENTHRSNWGGW